MNALGLSMIFKMGCLCSRDDITINNSKYYILEELGQGGFSTVLLVEHSRTRKRFAVKKIVCHGRDDQRDAVQEIEYHKMLNHPNIIPCLESCVIGCAHPIQNTTSQVLLLLPYYSRGTLAYYIDCKRKTKQYLPEEEILRIFLQICDGVKAFHDNKPIALAHRDIKPANILLDADNTPVIMDLGSVAPACVKVCGSTEAQRLQDTASERCSMPYRAPELFNVESYCMIDQRTDIWSLGCLFYAMCYFKSPYDAVYERGDSVALAVINGTIDFPTISPFSQDMHDLIRMMLKVSPMERPYIYTVIERTQELLQKHKIVA
ncbi:serine/threonine-protein kinase 16 [Cimex lectularius]|uniref:non-specific serine/threonine protein kinase n=1 Tax=Cimex lectularius TaxID=79782 RepID=A0A8I6TCM5_CIMLE|nr:serine/threonine-protein kinase 16 [Cimex lectularius]